MVKPGITNLYPGHEYDKTNHDWVLCALNKLCCFCFSKILYFYKFICLQPRGQICSSRDDHQRLWALWIIHFVCLIQIVTQGFTCHIRCAQKVNKWQLICPERLMLIKQIQSDSTQFEWYTNWSDHSPKIRRFWNRNVLHHMPIKTQKILISY